MEHLNPWLQALIGCTFSILIGILLFWIIKLLLTAERGPDRLKPVELISERELASRFLQAPNNPLWEATLAVLDLQVQDALEETLDEDLTNEKLRYRIGGVAELLKFKGNLLDRERQARLTEAEGEKETKESE